MATLVLRTVKGTPLTNSEVDGNFSNINTEVGTVFNRANTINSNVGVLSNLSTTEKSNLVAAINEIASESTSNVTITGGTISNVVLSNVTGINTSSIVGLTTANVTELTNLYFTDARAYANVVAAGFIDTVSNTAPIGASESGTTLTLTHLNSGVTAATYGNATFIPVITVNDSGHITSASNVAITATGGGSGLFNTSISAAANVAVNSAAANIYAAASTTGKRYIIHSIHITNIDGTNSAEITANIVGATYPSITLATTIPVPAGSSVELLKKPKVLQPSDYIRLNANVDSVLHATATIEEVTSTALFGAGIDVTSAATYTDLHTATSNSVLESILLANDDGTNDVKARVVWTDGSNNIQGYFAYDLIVPADATVEVLEQPKFLASGYKVRVYANQANRLEAIISGKTV